MWVNAIGGVCKVWSRLQGAAAACLNEHCMQLDCLYYTGLGKNGMSGSPLPGVSVDRVISQVKVLSHQLS